jgi:hypothetical protein
MMYGIKGDIDGDGRITYIDAVGTLQVASGIINDEETRLKADVNGDGEVTTDDVLVVLEHLSGKEIISGVI